MANVVKITGMQEFSEYTSNINPNGPIVLFCFTGAKLPTGESWCGDCNDVMPKSLKIHHIKTKNVNDYQEFLELTDNLKLKKGEHLICFFTGKKKENGRSWCIYCQMAQPIIETFLTEVKKDIIFAYVDVGDREYWKDRECPFRTHPKLKLLVIPTLIRWNGVQRLEGEQCCKKELLQMLIEDED